MPLASLKLGSRLLSLRQRPVMAAVWALVALGIIIILGTVTYRVFFQGQHLKRKVGEAVVAEEQARGAAGASQAAQELLVKRYETHTVIERRTAQGVENVYSIDDPSRVNPAIDAAGRDALCMHDAYRLVNRCPELSRPSS